MTKKVYKQKYFSRMQTGKFYLRIWLLLKDKIVEKSTFSLKNSTIKGAGGGQGGGGVHKKPI